MHTQVYGLLLACVRKLSGSCRKASGTEHMQVQHVARAGGDLHLRLPVSSADSDQGSNTIELAALATTQKSKT